VAFIYLYVTGGTLNLISLSSLSIAIGMVVDDAIVVLENITQTYERGSSPRDSATYGTNEVWLAVIASALVIMLYFFPLTLVGGQMGIMFQQFGYIYLSYNYCFYCCAAITLTPMMASRLLKLREKDTNRSKGGWYEKHIISKLDKLDLFYEKTLRWALNNKKKVILIAFSIFVASLFLLKFIPTTFMTQADQGTATAMIELQRENTC
jgi:HAE1 family hydrophobic/amphiphilic exporter-1